VQADHLALAIAAQGDETVFADRHFGFLTAGGPERMLEWLVGQLIRPVPKFRKVGEKVEIYSAIG